MNFNFTYQGLCDITPEGYAHLTHMLMSLASGKVIFVLEVGQHAYIAGFNQAVYV